MKITRDPVRHRPASDEAMDRTIPVQAFVIAGVCFLFAAAGMGRALYGTSLGIGVIFAIPVFAYGSTLALRRVQASMAARMIGGLTSAGNIKYQHQFSIQESLVARGRYDEAAESFRAHLAEHPDDVPARYRLATLHLRERNDPASAEEEFLALRRRPLDRSTAQLVSNHLIDIYRATDQRGRLMAELTRMMKERPGTPLADGAAKLLQELKRGS